MQATWWRPAEHRASPHQQQKAGRWRKGWCNSLKDCNTRRGRGEGREKRDSGSSCRPCGNPKTWSSAKAEWEAQQEACTTFYVLRLATEGKTRHTCTLWDYKIHNPSTLTVWSAHAVAYADKYLKEMHACSPTKTEFVGWSQINPFSTRNLHIYKGHCTWLTYSWLQPLFTKYYVLQLSPESS